MNNNYDIFIELLKKMVETPSFSRQEEKVADLIYNFLCEQKIDPKRFKNNIWALSKNYNPNRPTLLLNSHIDTVKPNSSYTKDPFEPIVEDGKLYGLGSNDAGASVVALIATFIELYSHEMSHNLVLAITAEEECSGSDGIEALLPLLPKIDLAIVGEPTCMEMAIGERGLLVLDCVAKGVAGHAAREEGVNAIYNAITDINWFQKYQFPKISPLFGDVKMNVTLMNAGSTHNVIPDKCEFTVDIRVPETYSFDEILETVNKNIASVCKPRSTRLKPSKIDPKHPLIIAGLKLGRSTYGSPTTSDAALLGDIPTLKMGVGDSARSHSADEFIYIQEIEHAIPLYIKLISQL